MRSLTIVTILALTACGGSSHQATPHAAQPVPATRPRTPTPTATAAPVASAPAPKLSAEPDLEFRLFTVTGMLTAAHPDQKPAAISIVMLEIGVTDVAGVPIQDLLASFNHAYTTWAESNSDWIVANMAREPAEAYWAAHKDDPTRHWTADGWK